MNNRKEESNLDCASKNVQQQRDQKCTCISSMGIKWKISKEAKIQNKEPQVTKKT